VGYCAFANPQYGIAVLLCEILITNQRFCNKNHRPDVLPPGGFVVSSQNRFCKIILSNSP